jgi:type II secretory pathway component PulF
MPLFRYKARNEFGSPLKGTLDSSGPEAVALHLSNLGFIPISIKEEQPGLFSDSFFSDFQRISPEDLIIFTRQLATLINAGLPFLSSMDSLVAQTENPRLKKTLLQVRRDVEGGLFFSDALIRHPKIFSSLFVNMVRAGEVGGVLDEILERLARLAEHEVETRNRIKVATRYPKIVMFALLVAFVILTTLVIPKFANLYSNFQVALPLPTRILIGINDAVHQYWYLMIGGTILAVGGIRHYLRTDPGRLWWDSFKLKIPVFGPIFLKTALSRFARVFGTLTRSGLPMLQTLDTVSTTVGNVLISRVINTLRESARQGKGLVQPMRVSGVFPPVVIQMVAIGEETGKMEEMLFKVSDYYDMEVEYKIKNLSASLEPILLVLIGGTVLFLALAIFLPWWNLVSVFKSGVGG